MAFVTEWLMTAGNFTLPLRTGFTYNMVVDWGDGGPTSEVTSYNDADATHNYAAGTFQISITGTCQALMIANGVTRLKLKKVIDWGDVGFTGAGLYQAFYGCSNLTVLPAGAMTGMGAVTQLRETFRGCSGLTAIPTGFFDNCTALTAMGYRSTFYQCTGLTAIPANLFDYSTGVTTQGFDSTFYGCTYITTIPANLFRYNTLVSTSGFYNTFAGCIRITAIPANLFDYNTAVSSSGFSYTFYGCIGLAGAIPTDLFKFNTALTTSAFYYTFWGCTYLTTIPVDLFRYNTGITTSAFFGTFQGCIRITAIPANLFDYNTAVNSDAFNSTFFGCTGITGAIPTDLFKFNTAVSTTGFYATFWGCTGITTIPTDLFRYNTLVSSSGFYSTFQGCTGLTGTIPTDLFRYNTGVSSSGFRATFKGCTGLTSISPDLFRYNTALTTFAFVETFYGCTGLTTIPTDLFRYNTGITISGFNSTFWGCTGITIIPTSIFQYNTLVSDSGFNSTFKGCTGITGAIPIDLFRYNTAVSTSGFNSTFSGCTGITTIPTDLFRYNTLVSTSGFYWTFYGCTGITSIPTDLFRYNTLVSTSGFYQTFYGCTGITTISVDLFRYNTLVSTDGFKQTFYNCSYLTTIPEDLFRFNTLCLSFYQTFYDCIRLVLNKNIFFADGDESTRFLNQSVNFTACFERASYSGAIGEAPKLWDCSFGTGTPIKTSCFSGAGNSLTSLYNYCSIPATWGATAAACNILLSSLITNIDLVSEYLVFRLSVSTIPVGGTISVYCSDTLIGLEDAGNLVSNDKVEDYIYASTLTPLGDKWYYILIVYINGGTRQTLSNSVYHYTVAQVGTTTINITSAGDYVTLDNPRHSYNHGLRFYNGFLYGSARGSWNGSTIGNSIFKLQANNYSVLAQVKFYSNKTAQTSPLGGCDQIVYCKGFLWCQVNNSEHLVRINPSDLDYMVFAISGTVTNFQPVGTDGVNLFVTNNTSVYKLDADNLLGSFASYGYDGTAPVAMPGGTELGSCLVQQNHPTIDSYVHSIVVDSANIYLAVTTGLADNGYDAVLDIYRFHLQKINKSTMATVGDVVIPKCTDDMVQNNEYVFLAPEFQTNSDDSLLGASWGLLAIRKSDLYIRYLKALHSEFNTTNETDRTCFGVQYFGDYIIVQLVTSKKSVVISTADVDLWGADFPVGGATFKLYLFQINGTNLSYPSNELFMDSDGIFHANTWTAGNTIVYKFTDEDVIVTNIPVVESILLESLIESTTIGGHILSTGGETITEEGFDYGVDPATLATHVVSAGTEIDFDEFLELTPGLYFFRAYATNVNGTGYGSIVPFIVGNTVILDKDNDDSVISLEHINSGHAVRCCKPAPGIADGVTGTFQDIDGNTYTTIVVNEIEWVVENLKVETYLDETAIPNLPDAEDWEADATGAVCEYV